jgi:hypothetical protein
VGKKEKHHVTAGNRTPAVQPLYQLSYPGSLNFLGCHIKIIGQYNEKQLLEVSIRENYRNVVYNNIRQTMDMAQHN